MKPSRETERAVFDIATSSLDFGSGFLDDEEVEHLRKYAEYLGVSEWSATPHNFLDKYCPGHQFERMGREAPDGSQSGRCSVCGKVEWRAFGPTA